MSKLIFILLLFSKITFSQEIDDNRYEAHIALAEQYNSAYRFDESITEIEKALAIAKLENNEWGIIDAQISLSELMRRTQNYVKGIALLTDQKNYAKYPDLHVRRLGRMAALYAEGDYFEETFSDEVKVVDSIRLFLDEALKITIANDFITQEAGLQNELGLFIIRNEDREKGTAHLQRSAALFLELGDTINYMRPMIYLMENDMVFGNFERFDAKANELLALSKNKGWYNPKADLYQLISKRHALVGDSLNYYKWKLKANNNHLEFQKKISNDGMISYEVLYETEKFQKEAFASDLLALEKSKELEEQTIKTNYLYVLLLLLLIVVLAIIIVYFRERKLKNKLDGTNQELNLSNEKYQLLAVESNHRIKNNLQMVISMIQYLDKDLSLEEKKLTNNISGKIHTINSLHRHLTMGVHNELVDLGQYFQDILNLYANLNSDFKISKSFDPIKVESERIIYFGLILNELISNTIKHHKSDKKEIQILLYTEKSQHYFSYCDHSVVKAENDTGIGVNLVDRLTSRIRGTEIEFDKSTGQYKFSFHA